MIFTVTFNPALDVSGIVDSLVPNEKCYVYSEMLHPGGNGINAGIVAKRLGSKVILSGFLGGSNGNTIRELLLEEKTVHRFISIKSNSRMNITISDKTTKKQTRLSFTGPKVLGTEWKSLLRILNKVNPEKDIVILGGSLPPGISEDDVAIQVQALRTRGVFCMVDMPPRALKKIINAEPNFIKPNLKEFQEITKSKAEKIDDVLNAMKKLQKKVPIICVSSVEGGAILANDQEAWFGKTPKLTVHSSVGAGDSMVGAMATLLHSNPNTPLSDLLRIGLAAAGATLSESGLILGSQGSIKQLMPKIRLTNISIPKR